MVQPSKIFIFSHVFQKLPKQPKTTRWDKFIFTVFNLCSCHGNHVWATDAPWGCPHNITVLSLEGFKLKCWNFQKMILICFSIQWTTETTFSQNRLKIITKTTWTFKNWENKYSYFGHWKTRIALKCMIVVYWMQKHTELSHSKNGRNWIKPWKVIFVSVLVFSWNLKFQEIII